MWMKVKAIPVTGCGGPWDFGMSRLPHFLDSQLIDSDKVVILNSWLLPITLSKIPGANFFLRLSLLQGHSVVLPHLLLENLKM
jgi:hypothetical protein